MTWPVAWPPAVLACPLGSTRPLSLLLPPLFPFGEFIQHHPYDPYVYPSWLFFVFEGTALLHLLPLVRHIKITPHSYVFTVLYRYLNFKQVYDVIDTLFHIFGKSTPNIDYVFERWAIFLQITSKYLCLTPEPIGRF